MQRDRSTKVTSCTSATQSHLSLLQHLCTHKETEGYNLTGKQMRLKIQWNLSCLSREKEKCQTPLTSPLWQARQAEVIPLSATKYFAERLRFSAACPLEDWKKNHYYCMQAKLKIKRRRWLLYRELHFRVWWGCGTNRLGTAKLKFNFTFQNSLRKASILEICLWNTSTRP